jgi:hypothetical protein
MGLVECLTRSAGQKFDSRAGILAYLDAIRDTKPSRMADEAMKRLIEADKRSEDHERAA